LVRKTLWVVTISISQAPTGSPRDWFLPERHRALLSRWSDAWLIDGVRTPFIDYTQAFGLISPIDLGIKVAREVFA